jgi:DNA replicative helicase MCM subunit Mcm2 (Cdc46/Mcm family)
VEGGFPYMAHTFEELKKMTVAEMREIAAGLEHEALKGYTQLNKEHLLAALCKALNIDMFVHHEVVGIDKAGIKAEIRQLKKQRAEAIKSKNHDQLVQVRGRIQNLKKILRRAEL